MRRRRVIKRLQLGPVVGHTDDASARVWIQAFDDPARYALRVQGAGLYPFASTELGPLEFNTGIAVADGLRPDWQYRYSVLRLGRLIHGAGGSFRTLPAPSSAADLLFCAISCSSAAEDGSWEPFRQFVEDSLPQFVVMMGDQVYLDETTPTSSTTTSSRLAGTAPRDGRKYRLNWSREPVRRVLANVPTYMIWDDHDIRDGWGSSAADSPTLLAKHPRGEAIFRKSTAFFEDARDVYWHFQGCHNPVPSGRARSCLPNYIAGRSSAGGAARCRSSSAAGAGGARAGQPRRAGRVPGAVPGARRRAVAVRRAGLRQPASRRRGARGRDADADRLARADGRC